MTSWLEELQRREAAARERAQELRDRIAELSGQLAGEERLLERLAITRETMSEILSAPTHLAPDSVLAGENETRGNSGPGSGAGGGSPVGVMLVPPA